MSKLRNLFPQKRRALENDLDRELRYHMDRRIEDLLREGKSEAEAKRLATIELGGVAQVEDEVRETWIWRWLDHLLRDTHYALRVLRRSPGFTATAVLSLALGIGANASIFSLVDQVLLRLLPVKDPQSLVLVDWKGNQLADGWGSGNLVSYPFCKDLQQQDRMFDGVFCRHPTMVTLSTGQRPLPVGAEIVSGSYFPVLGVHAAIGRLIDESDDLQPEAHPVVVLSYDYWKNQLGGDPKIVGTKLLVNNHPMAVIGVAEATFHGVDLGEVPALWIPAMMKRQATPEWDRLFDRRARWMHVFGRLKPGLSAERAQSGLQPWFKAMLESDTRLEGFPPVAAEQRKAFLASTIEVTPAAQGRSDLRQELDRPLVVLLSGTLLLLLLACLNVASLFLARGVTRSREVTTRMALGASRGRITSQLLVDSLLVSLAGGLLGMAAAPLVSQALLSFLPKGIAGVDLSPAPDYRVFLFAMAVSLATGVLCGVGPALRLSRSRLFSSLKARTQIAEGGGVGIRKALVVGQMAFTLVLLIGAGLFVQTLARLHEKGTGFESSSLVSFQVNPVRTGYSAVDAKLFIRNLLAKLQSSPSVESAAVAGIQLLNGGSWNTYLTIDFQGRMVTDRVTHVNPVSPEFFSTLGTRIVAGRDFNNRDTADIRSTDTSFRSVIINESFARRYFGDENPIGHRIGFGREPGVITSMEIVGVVKNFSYRGIREESEQAFFPFWEQPGGNGVFYVKVRGNPESAFASIREAAGKLDAALPLMSLRTVDEQIKRSLRTERMLATLSTAFGLIALLLAAVGLYGVMSFVVTNRTQEIGVRMALGASRASALWFVLRDALLIIAGGTAIALPCVWALSRLVESQLFGIGAFDGGTVAAASATLAIVAVAAAMLPAWRAASVNPTQALRFE